jgi:hypothetical protein
MDFSRIASNSLPPGGMLPVAHQGGAGLPSGSGSTAAAMPRISTAALTAAAHLPLPALPAPGAGASPDPAHAAAIRQAGWNDTFPPRIRQAYLNVLQRLWHSTGKTDPAERCHLHNRSQSLLQRLAYAEFQSARFRDRPVGRSLERLDKTALSPLIAAAIGHRPEAIVFDLRDYGAAIPALEGMLAQSAVYLKANDSFRGERVFKMERCEGGGYAITDAAGGVERVGHLDRYQPPAAHLRSMNVFIAEAEIPIARMENGATWELRMLPPQLPDWSYAKVGKAGSVVNNVAQGGSSTSAVDVVRSVVRMRFAQADEAEVEQRAAAFVRQATQLAGQVKDLTDAVQLHTARAIVLPQDLKQPDAYEETMRHCFSGNFLCVDVTGMWDQNGELIPMVIEAQTSAHLPPWLAGDAYETTLETMNGKRACLQDALR